MKNQDTDFLESKFHKYLKLSKKDISALEPKYARIYRMAMNYAENPTAWREYKNKAGKPRGPYMKGEKKSNPRATKDKMVKLNVFSGSTEPNVVSALLRHLEVTNMLIKKALAE